MIRIEDFFVYKYKSSSREREKRARIFFYLTLSGMGILMVVSIMEAAFGFAFVMYAPYLFGVFISIIILLLLRLGFFNLSSLFFMITLIVIQSFALILDKYDNPFDLYRYTLTITSVLIATGLISFSVFNIIAVTITGLLGIFIFYIVRYSYQLNNPLEPVVIMSLIVSSSIFLFFGVLSLLILKITKNMLHVAEKNEKAAQKDRDKTLQTLFILQTYTKPSLVEKIYEGTDPTKLLPEEKELVVLFSDIRGFSALTESLTPSDVINILNPYFTTMNSIVVDNNGEIDKLIGDCFMAIFDNPDDAMNAAIDMRKSLIGFTIDRKQLRTGIGIHYGKVIKGNIGSSSKMDNTVIGEVVNMSSRFESLTKVYNTGIIVSDEFKEKLTKSHYFADLDIIRVKGMHRPVKIYGIYDEYSANCDISDTNYHDLITDAFSKYVNGDFDEAVKVYYKIIQDYPYDPDKYSFDPHSHLRFMIERSLETKSLVESGKIDMWSGIYDFQIK